MAKIWFCEPEFIKSYQERVLNITPEERASALSQFGIDEFPDDILEMKGDTSSIRVVGLLTRAGPTFIDKYFGFEVTGYGQIVDALTRCAANPMIKNIDLLIDSPGGEVNGCDDVYVAVRDLAKQKNVRAVNVGLMASAAYYLGCPANEIVATGPGCLTGSIGVVISTYDWSGAMDKMGVKKVTIVSKNAPDKAPNVATSQGIEVLQRHVDALERVFYARIAEARKITPEEIAEKYGQGWVLLAQDPDPNEPDALSNGLIDKIEQKLKLPRSQKTSFDEEEKTNSAVDTPLMEENAMKLTQFLSENPEAKAEFDQNQASQYQAGVKAGREEVETRAKAAADFIGPNSKYPAPVQALAVQVVAGTMSVDALKGAAAVYDAISESAKSDKAKSDTKEQGSTQTVEGAAQGSTEVVKTAEGALAMAAADKKAMVGA
jgi:ClpP class serine protease